MSLDLYLRYPSCEHCGSPGHTVYDTNITHNLGLMASKCIVRPSLIRQAANPNCPFDILDQIGMAYESNTLKEISEDLTLYEILWRPDEHNFKTASQVIWFLEVGIDELKSKPEYFRQFNASNGWGMYEHFVPFVSNFLKACKENPKAEIEASR